MAESKASGMFVASSAVLRGVISAPLELARRRSAIAKMDQPDSINLVIESEIIPRLLMAHASGGDAATTRGGRPINPEDASRFALLPLRLEAASLLEEVDGFIANGASVETICLDLLAPAARKLGEMWETDECDFLDVTMGLWRLQEVMREIAARSPSEHGAICPQRSALFSPMPGDNHNFGTLMIDEVFARGGWKSEALVKPERRELLDRLARQPFDLAGLTLGRDCPSAALGNLIKAMRNVSANPHIIVLVGGRMINENPDIANEVGADGTGADALTALDVANSLIRSPAAASSNLR
ncbi:cobalamin B12-binding domain-containing protein [Porphyrobacter sp. AAP60]|uniref:cobalamin B12-binding domain-containing protein n=1 Tax=Porphyrobacter sp. AAP60 TaxID=1523423 RepID=UPI0006CC728B|nr:cobalamin B12-binding domain-containing protein [Porphyrobacter sp. AAP60]KPF62019.1 cobalamin B12-binding protein [Porphyrobacter sp. AAP60]